MNTPFDACPPLLHGVSRSFQPPFNSLASAPVVDSLNAHIPDPLPLPEPAPLPVFSSNPYNLPTFSSHSHTLEKPHHTNITTSPTPKHKPIQSHHRHVTTLLDDSITHNTAALETLHDPLITLTSTMPPGLQQSLDFLYSKPALTQPVYAPPHTVSQPTTTLQAQISSNYQDFTPPPLTVSPPPLPQLYAHMFITRSDLSRYYHHCVISPISSSNTIQTQPLLSISTLIRRSLQQTHQQHHMQPSSRLKILNPGQSPNIDLDMRQFTLHHHLQYQSHTAHTRRNTHANYLSNSSHGTTFVPFNRHQDPFINSLFVYVQQLHDYLRSVCNLESSCDENINIFSENPENVQDNEHSDSFCNKFPHKSRHTDINIDYNTIILQLTNILLLLSQYIFNPDEYTLQITPKYSQNLDPLVTQSLLSDLSSLQDTRVLLTTSPSPTLASQLHSRLTALLSKFTPADLTPSSSLASALLPPPPLTIFPAQLFEDGVKWKFIWIELSLSPHSYIERIERDNDLSYDIYENQENEHTLTSLRLVSSIPIHYWGVDPGTGNYKCGAACTNSYGLGHITNTCQPLLANQCSEGPYPFSEALQCKTLHITNECDGNKKDHDCIEMSQIEQVSRICSCVNITNGSYYEYLSKIQRDDEMPNHNKKRIIQRFFKQNHILSSIYNNNNSLMTPLTQELIKNIPIPSTINYKVNADNTPNITHNHNIIPLTDHHTDYIDQCNSNPWLLHHESESQNNSDTITKKRETSLQNAWTRGGLTPDEFEEAEYWLNDINNTTTSGLSHGFTRLMQHTLRSQFNHYYSSKRSNNCDNSELIAKINCFEDQIEDNPSCECLRPKLSMCPHTATVVGWNDKEMKCVYASNAPTINSGYNKQDDHKILNDDHNNNINNHNNNNHHIQNNTNCSNNPQNPYQHHIFHKSGDNIHNPLTCTARVVCNGPISHYNNLLDLFSIYSQESQPTTSADIISPFSSVISRHSTDFHQKSPQADVNIPKNVSSSPLNKPPSPSIFEQFYSFFETIIESSFLPIILYTPSDYEILNNCYSNLAITIKHAAMLFGNVIKHLTNLSEAQDEYNRFIRQSCLRCRVASHHSPTSTLVSDRQALLLRLKKTVDHNIKVLDLYLDDMHSQITKLSTLGNFHIPTPSQKGKHKQHSKTTNISSEITKYDENFTDFNVTYVLISDISQMFNNLSPISKKDPASHSPSSHISSHAETLWKGIINEIYDAFTHPFLGCKEVMSDATAVLDKVTFPPQLKNGTEEVESIVSQCSSCPLGAWDNQKVSNLINKDENTIQNGHSIVINAENEEFLDDDDDIDRLSADFNAFLGNYDDHDDNDDNINDDLNDDRIETFHTGVPHPYDSLQSNEKQPTKEDSFSSVDWIQVNNQFEITLRSWLNRFHDVWADLLNTHHIPVLFPTREKLFSLNDVSNSKSSQNNQSKPLDRVKKITSFPLQYYQFLVTPQNKSIFAYNMAQIRIFYHIFKIGFTSTLQPSQPTPSSASTGRKRTHDPHSSLDSPIFPPNSGNSSLNFPDANHNLYSSPNSYPHNIKSGYYTSPSALFDTQHQNPPLISTEEQMLEQHNISIFQRFYSQFISVHRNSDTLDSVLCLLDQFMEFLKSRSAFTNLTTSIHECGFCHECNQCADCCVHNTLSNLSIFSIRSIPTLNPYKFYDFYMDFYNVYQLSHRYALLDDIAINNHSYDLIGLNVSVNPVTGNVGSLVDSTNLTLTYQYAQNFSTYQNLVAQRGATNLFVSINTGDYVLLQNSPISAKILQTKHSQNLPTPQNSPQITEENLSKLHQNHCNCDCNTAFGIIWLVSDSRVLMLRLNSLFLTRTVSIVSRYVLEHTNTPQQWLLKKKAFRYALPFLQQQTIAHHNLVLAQNLKTIKPEETPVTPSNSTTMNSISLTTVPESVFAYNMTTFSTQPHSHSESLLTTSFSDVNNPLLLSTRYVDPALDGICTLLPPDYNQPQTTSSLPLTDDLDNISRFYEANKTQKYSSIIDYLPFSGHYNTKPITLLQKEKCGVLTLQLPPCLFLQPARYSATNGYVAPGDISPIGNGETSLNAPTTTATTSVYETLPNWDVTNYYVHKFWTGLQPNFVYSGHNSFYSPMSNQPLNHSTLLTSTYSGLNAVSPLVYYHYITNNLLLNKQPQLSDVVKIIETTLVPSSQSQLLSEKNQKNNSRPQYDDKTAKLVLKLLKNRFDNQTSNNIANSNNSQFNISPGEIDRIQQVFAQTIQRAYDYTYIPPNFSQHDYTSSASSHLTLLPTSVPHRQQYGLYAVPAYIASMYEKITRTTTYLSNLSKHKHIFQQSAQSRPIDMVDILSRDIYHYIQSITSQPISNSPTTNQPLPPQTLLNSLLPFPQSQPAFHLAHAYTLPTTSAGEPYVYREFYFTLYGGMLFYYKDSRVTAPTDFLCLQHSTIQLDRRAINRGEFIFIITTPLRSLVLKAKHYIQMMEWVTQISHSAQQTASVPVLAPYHVRCDHGVWENNLYSKRKTSSNSLNSYNMSYTAGLGPTNELNPSKYTVLVIHNSIRPFYHFKSNYRSLLQCGYDEVIWAVFHYIEKYDTIKHKHYENNVKLFQLLSNAMMMVIHIIMVLIKATESSHNSTIDHHSIDEYMRQLSQLIEQIDQNNTKNANRNNNTNVTTTMILSVIISTMKQILIIFGPIHQQLPVTTQQNYNVLLKSKLSALLTTCYQLFPIIYHKYIQNKARHVTLCQSIQQASLSTHFTLPFGLGNDTYMVYALVNSFLQSYHSNPTGFIHQYRSHLPQQNSDNLTTLTNREVINTLITIIHKINQHLPNRESFVNEIISTLLNPPLNEDNTPNTQHITENMTKHAHFLSTLYNSGGNPSKINWTHCSHETRDISQQYYNIYQYNSDQHDKRINDTQNNRLECIPFKDHFHSFSLLQNQNLFGLYRCPEKCKFIYPLYRASNKIFSYPHPKYHFTPQAPLIHQINQRDPAFATTINSIISNMYSTLNPFAILKTPSQIMLQTNKTSATSPSQPHYNAGIGLKHILLYLLYRPSYHITFNQHSKEVSQTLQRNLLINPKQLKIPEQLSHSLNSSSSLDKNPFELEQNPSPIPGYSFELLLSDKQLLNIFKKYMHNITIPRYYDDIMSIFYQTILSSNSSVQHQISQAITSILPTEARIQTPIMRPSSSSSTGSPIFSLASIPRSQSNVFNPTIPPQTRQHTQHTEIIQDLINSINTSIITHLSSANKYSPNGLSNSLDSLSHGINTNNRLNGGMINYNHISLLYAMYWSANSLQKYHLFSHLRYMGKFLSNTIQNTKNNHLITRLLSTLNIYKFSPKKFYDPDELYQLSAVTFFKQVLLKQFLDFLQYFFRFTLSSSFSHFYRTKDSKTLSNNQSSTNLTVNRLTVSTTPTSHHPPQPILDIHSIFDHNNHANNNGNNITLSNKLVTSLINSNSCNFPSITHYFLDSIKSSLLSHISRQIDAHISFYLYIKEYTALPNIISTTTPPYLSKLHKHFFIASNNASTTSSNSTQYIIPLTFSHDPVDQNDQETNQLAHDSNSSFRSVDLIREFQSFYKTNNLPITKHSFLKYYSQQLQKGGNMLDQKSKYHGLHNNALYPDIFGNNVQYNNQTRQNQLNNQESHQRIILKRVVYTQLFSHFLDTIITDEEGEDDGRAYNKLVNLNQYLLDIDDDNNEENQENDQNSDSNSEYENDEDGEEEEDEYSDEDSQSDEDQKTPLTQIEKRFNEKYPYTTPSRALERYYYTSATLLYGTRDVDGVLLLEKELPKSPMNSHHDDNSSENSTYLDSEGNTDHEDDEDDDEDIQYDENYELDLTHDFEGSETQDLSDEIQLDDFLINTAALLKSQQIRSKNTDASFKRFWRQKQSNLWEEYLDMEEQLYKLDQLIQLSPPPRAIITNNEPNVNGTSSQQYPHQQYTKQFPPNFASLLQEERQRQLQIKAENYTTASNILLALQANIKRQKIRREQEVLQFPQFVQTCHKTPHFHLPNEEIIAQTHTDFFQQRVITHNSQTQQDTNDKHVFTEEEVDALIFPKIVEERTLDPVLTYQNYLQIIREQKKSRETRVLKAKKGLSQNTINTMKQMIIQPTTRAVTNLLDACCMLFTTYLSPLSPTAIHNIPETFVNHIVMVIVYELIYNDRFGVYNNNNSQFREIDQESVGMNDELNLSVTSDVSYYNYVYTNKRLSHCDQSVTNCVQFYLDKVHTIKERVSLYSSSTDSAPKQSSIASPQQSNFIDQLIQTTLEANTQLEQDVNAGDNEVKKLVINEPSSHFFSPNQLSTMDSAQIASATSLLNVTNTHQNLDNEYDHHHRNNTTSPFSNISAIAQRNAKYIQLQSIQGQSGSQAANASAIDYINVKSHISQLYSYFSKCYQDDQSKENVETQDKSIFASLSISSFEDLLLKLNSFLQNEDFFVDKSSHTVITTLSMSQQKTLQKPAKSEIQKNEIHKNDDINANLHQDLLNRFQSYYQNQLPLPSNNFTNNPSQLRIYPLRCNCKLIATNHLPHIHNQIFLDIADILYTRIQHWFVNFLSCPIIDISSISIRPDTKLSTPVTSSAPVTAASVFSPLTPTSQQSQTIYHSHSPIDSIPNNTDQNNSSSTNSSPSNSSFPNLSQIVFINQKNVFNLVINNPVLGSYLMKTTPHYQQYLQLYQHLLNNNLDQSDQNDSKNYIEFILKQPLPLHFFNTQGYTFHQQHQHVPQQVLQSVTNGLFIISSKLFASSTPFSPKLVREFYHNIVFPKLAKMEYMLLNTILLYQHYKTKLFNTSELNTIKKRTNNPKITSNDFYKYQALIHYDYSYNIIRYFEYIPQRPQTVLNDQNHVPSHHLTILTPRMSNVNSDVQNEADDTSKAQLVAHDPAFLQYYIMNVIPANLAETLHQQQRLLQTTDGDSDDKHSKPHKSSSESDNLDHIINSDINDRDVLKISRIEREREAIDEEILSNPSLLLPYQPLWRPDQRVLYQSFVEQFNKHVLEQHHPQHNQLDLSALKHPPMIESALIHDKPIRPRLTNSASNDDELFNKYITSQQHLTESSSSQAIPNPIHHSNLKSKLLVSDPSLSLFYKQYLQYQSHQILFNIYLRQTTSQYETINTPTINAYPLQERLVAEMEYAYQNNITLDSFGYRNNKNGNKLTSIQQSSAFPFTNKTRFNTRQEKLLQPQLVPKKEDTQYFWCLVIQSSKQASNSVNKKSNDKIKPAKTNSTTSLLSVTHSKPSKISSSYSEQIVTLIAPGVEITMGREHINHITIDDTRVSRSHAKVTILEQRSNNDEKSSSISALSAPNNPTADINSIPDLPTLPQPSTHLKYTDLGSSAGSKINGSLVFSTILSHGDVIEIGLTQIFVYHLPKFLLDHLRESGTE